MLRRLKNPGLRVTLLVTFTLALAFILGVLYFRLSWEVSDFLENRLVQHGHEKAQEIARLLVRQGEGAREVLALGSLVESDKDFKYVALVSDSGEILPDVPEAGERPARLEEHAMRFFQPGAPTRLELPDGNLLLAEPVFSSNDKGGPGSRRVVVVVVDTAPLREVQHWLGFTLLGAFITGWVLVVALIFLVTHVLILRPLGAMMAAARKMAEGDLTGRVELAAGGEMGQLAEALDGIGQSLRNTLSSVRGVSSVVAGVIEQLSRTGLTVSSGASTIQARVEETSSSMEQMLASLRGIAENVEVLYQSAEESSSSIMEMAATNDEVTENVHAMAGSVEETTSAIEEMTFSIKEVAKNIEELSASTEETSSSISQMDSSISQVGVNANETARLSEHVSEDAQTGVEALRKTMLGLERIKQSSLGASGVIESLGRRISEIGNILNVIDDVAEQTNLLALNAAIIAAQAGEHGKGFAVVADEIKELAERTANSTKEIADLIRNVQEESRNAMTVMGQGVRNVEEGVQLGREAEGALRKINDSAQKSTQMVQAIARATVEQTRGSKQVTAAIHRISETVQMISRASNEQAKGSEQIIKSSEKMKAITAHVQRSSQEQAHGSKQITRSIESINEMVTHLNRAQKEQTKGSEQVLKAVEAIKGVSEHQTRLVKALEEAIDSLQRQSEVLRAEMRRFKV
ncbi:MAG TPA: methyl-accepting chemotaxis protein [Myxococcaceae bacterium]|nr:methyl-accepting chemotaxis protein [Myxococcaceae bacterium]